MPQDYGGGMYQGIMDVLGPKIERQHVLEDEMRKGRIAQITKAIESGNLSPDEIANLEDEITSMYSSPVVKKQMKGALQRLNDYRQKIANPPPPPPSTTSPIPGAPPTPGMTPPPSVATGTPTDTSDITPPQKTMEGTIYQGSPLEPPPSIAAAAPTPAPTPATPSYPTGDTLPSMITKSQQGLDVESRRKLVVAKELSAGEQAAEERKLKQQHENAMELESLKEKGRSRKLEVQLAGKGYKLDDSDNIVPMENVNLSEEVRMKIARQRSQTDLDASRKELMEAQADLAKSKADPNSPANRAIGLRLALSQKRYDLANANYFAMNYGTDPEGTALPGVLRMPDGTPVGRGNAANVRPTTTTRQMAETMTMLAPKMDALITKLDDPQFADKLGPVVGRWNEFMTGKVGTGDPDFIAIRNAVGLMQTAELRAHVGARGGQMMLEKFDALNNADRMDAPTLKAALLSVKDFLSGYSNYVFGPTGPMREMKQGPPSTRPKPGETEPRKRSEIQSKYGVKY